MLLGSLDHETTDPMKATSENLKIKQAGRHALCQGDEQFATYCRQVMEREKQDGPSDQLCRKPPNGPVLLKLSKLQLALPELKFLRAGLPEAELDQRDSALRCAVHFLETLHLMETHRQAQSHKHKTEL